MINFNLVDLMHALWLLDFYERANVTHEELSLPPSGEPTGILDLARLGGGKSKYLSKIDTDNGQQIIAAVGKIAAKLKLETAGHRLDHFEMALRYSITETDYKNEIKVLRDALKHDLSRTHFYHYPQAKLEVLMKFYKQWNPIGKAFPAALSEALVATDCYALGHDTACIFHIMRAAEHGLRALAKERRIKLAKNKPVEWGMWQEIISELNKEAAKIGLKATAGTAKDNALSFYSGALSDLNAFKDEYRNQVMHARKNYDEHQALRALVKVHAFMERLTEKMTDKHHKIRWGLKFKAS
ncbi:hypothetical protein [Bradyrhizobium japonicum]|uniref:hypothetical protein n=1 Tax=Bradyrhizobium japonicum TaxID=375 RepID=UPI002714A299|nr:hypothetical protein [Bradyrhizobium japonicum]WLB56894.1 hypothetical protein QIH94_13210 [Bradyrhizobium japonicum]WLB61212.1 hypothetical protein QIH96_32595 [Bradyrhizobium japonicum]